MTTTTCTLIRMALAIALAACGKGADKLAAQDHDEHGDKGHGDEHGGDKGGDQGHDEHGDEHGEDGLVTLTPEQVATAKLATAAAERRAVSTEIAATGAIAPPEDGIARVGAKLAGRVTRLAAGTGAHVRRGQVLGAIDSPELGRAKADYVAAVAAARVARDIADREQALWEKKVSAERDYRLAEAEAVKTRAEKEAAEVRLHTLGLSDAQLARLTADQHQASSIALVAPIDGVVVERPVTLGQMIDPATTTFVIMDLRTVWILVDVYERDLAQVAVGGRVEARVKAWPDRAFAGTIASIGAVVEERTRAVRVRVALDNADGALKPGMFATVVLAGSRGEAREGLFVPAAAVQRDGAAAIVFVPVGDRRFQLRTVEVGARTADWVEVTSGLAPGEHVVTTGAFQLKSEARRDRFGGHEH